MNLTLVTMTAIICVTIIAVMQIAANTNKDEDDK